MHQVALRQQKQPKISEILNKKNNGTTEVTVLTMFWVFGKFSLLFMFSVAEEQVVLRDSGSWDQSYTADQGAGTTEPGHHGG